MRKYVSIVGVGTRMTGTGKVTGKKYDFTPVAITYEDDFISGLKAATTNINQDCMGSYCPAVGDVIEVVMREDYKSGRVYIDAVL